MKKYNFWLGVGLTLALLSLAAIHYYTDVPNNPNPAGTYAVSLDTGDHAPGGTPYNWISIDQLSARIGSASTVGFLHTNNDIGYNETFLSGTTFGGTGAAVEAQTGTRYWGDGGGITNLLILPGANISFSTNGSGVVTISASGNIVVQTITNNTFVNTNVLISTSNAFFNTTYVTNLYSDNITNNTFVNTNVSIITAIQYVNNTTITNANITNLFFISGKGNTLIITNNFSVGGSQTNLLIAASSAVITKADQVLTNAVNAHGVFTNSATGPPSFGLLQNTELQNSSITIQGSAVALGGSTLAAGSSPFFNAANITNVQGGTIVGGTKTWQFDGSFLWPGDTLPATWTTNTPGAGPGQIQSAGPSIKAWQFSTSATNQVLLQVPMPADWDQSTVNCWISLDSGTNSATANAITNVWSVSAAKVGTALGTAVTITNNLPGGTGLIATNFDFANLTIAGSPKPADYCVFQIQARGGNTPFSSTNTLLLVAFGMRYGVTNIQNNAIQWP